MNYPKTEKTALIQVARLSDMREDWHRAAREYEGLAEIFPGDPFILEPLAKAQQKLGLKEASIVTLFKAAEGYAAKGLSLKAAQLRKRLYELPAAHQLPVAMSN